MGGTISWCMGTNANENSNIKMQVLKGREMSSRSKPQQSNGRPQQSRPQTISLKGPMYTSGSMENKYELLSEIGHGSTSVVYRCRNRYNGELYACKIIDRRALQAKRNDVTEQIQVEIQVLQSMKHENIIHIEDVYITDTKICMITEYMDGGELFDYVVAKGTLSEVEASAIVRKIISAVAYMHACGVIHRDLKPENLMLAKPTSKAADVKIIDFGLAKLMAEDDKTESFLGTRGYLAPEMLQRQAYSKTVDMWALGVIVYVLLCGCLPFNDDGKRIAASEAVAREKFNLRFPKWADGLSVSAKDLLKHLLDVDATKRYTAEQALMHPWVTGAKTPNKYLKSPKHLRTIRPNGRRDNSAKSKSRESANKVVSANGSGGRGKNTVPPDVPVQEMRVNGGRGVGSRRLSH